MFTPSTRSSIPKTILINATGGDSITIDGNYKVHTFNNSGTFTITWRNLGYTPTISAICLGGGAGGEGGTYSGETDSGGRGGGGSALSTKSTSINNTGTLTITIGAGGANGTAGDAGNSPGQGSGGSSSSITDSGIGVASMAVTQTGGAVLGGGAKGIPSPPTAPTAGGSGTSSSITGTSVQYGRGGGGGGYGLDYNAGTCSQIDGAPGRPENVILGTYYPGYGGRGGLAAASCEFAAEDGATGYPTGDGGGGGGGGYKDSSSTDHNGGAGGTGGAGIVIIRYQYRL